MRWHGRVRSTLVRLRRCAPRGARGGRRRAVGGGWREAFEAVRHGGARALCLSPSAVRLLTSRSRVRGRRCARAREQWPVTPLLVRCRSGPPPLFRGGIARVAGVSNLTRCWPRTRAVGTAAGVREGRGREARRLGGARVRGRAVLLDYSGLLTPLHRSPLQVPGPDAHRAPPPPPPSPPSLSRGPIALSRRPAAPKVRRPRRPPCGCAAPPARSRGSRLYGLMSEGQ